LDIAQEKFPKKEFQVSEITDTNFPDGSFDLIFSMHLFMHLDYEKIQSTFREVDRILRPNGVFIFDVPSALRRGMTKGHKNESWHGSTSFTIEEIKEIIPENWSLHQTHGVLFFPIHRIPSKLRPLFFRLDRFLCRNFAPYSSYLILVIEKDEL
ncbi:MAG: class I SAM-dependent methyltransferase, partial [Saprospiraceae bacterium]